MLIEIPNVLQAAEVTECRTALEQAAWEDGRNSAGYLSQAVKRNVQLADSNPTARKLGETILVALENNALFTSAALPLKVLPPLFNRYGPGQAYGPHVDGAIRPVAGTPHRVRTDLSATLFLSDPESYDGGELVVRDASGEHSLKLAAGAMVLYPGTSVHRVEPIRRELFGRKSPPIFAAEIKVKDPTIFQALDPVIRALDDLTRLWDLSPVRLMESRGQRLT